jgi:hypothetical protein
VSGRSAALPIRALILLTRAEPLAPPGRALFLLSTFAEMAAVIPCTDVDRATGGSSARSMRANGRTGRDRARRPVRRFAPHPMCPAQGES